IYHIVAGTFGWFSILLPLALALIAVRFFRLPQADSAIGLIFFVLLFTTIVGSGICSPFFDNPSMCPRLADQLTSSGVVGDFVVDPLATLSTPIPVWILMVVIGFFSILVMTATPVGKIPDRIIGAYRWLTGQDVVAENETAAVEATESQRTHADHDQSYLYE